MQQVYEKWRRFKENHYSKSKAKHRQDMVSWESDKPWLDLQYHNNGQIQKPHELESKMIDPPDTVDDGLLDRIHGSLIGLAIGDALGAHVEFHSHSYLVENSVTDLIGGGTWGLEKGQFTDDTSMALCLASSLVTRQQFEPYDQMVRYKWWYDYGYMSSTGSCFDIGAASKNAISVFKQRQATFAKKHHLNSNDIDHLTDTALLHQFDAFCSKTDVAGNGALMRLAPVPLFFHKHLQEAIAFSGISALITHGDVKAEDACRYFAALIFASINGYKKDELLDNHFYQKHEAWFGKNSLCDEVQQIIRGSYKRNGGYADGIRGKGYILYSLEAAMWAFWSDEDSFEKGVLAAVNLGDDADTTAAIYGQLAGAYYGYKKLPDGWKHGIYAEKFIFNMSKWIVYEGSHWKPTDLAISSDSCLSFEKKSSSVFNLVPITQSSTSCEHKRSSGSHATPLRRKFFRNDPRHGHSSKTRD